MFTITPYSPRHAEAWDAFVEQSKNGTFLLQRPYMDYHADRFTDHSLLVFCNAQLYALLPASVDAQGVVCSHGGLTYGGLLLNEHATTEGVIEALQLIVAHLRAEGLRRLVLRPTPWIYHRLPAEEALYALTMRLGAQLTVREVSTCIDRRERVAWSQLRRRGAKRAATAGVSIEASTRFDAFWPILEENLFVRHGVRPVHTLEEMQLLHSRFPQNIRLFLARTAEGEVVAGTVLFVTKRVVHSQYISASEAGKKLGALDALFHHVLTNELLDIPYFDFGKSTEAGGTILNEGLISQKEGFGGRALCYDTYEISLSPAR